MKPYVFSGPRKIEPPKGFWQGAFFHRSAPAAGGSPAGAVRAMVRRFAPRLRDRRVRRPEHTRD